MNELEMVLDKCWQNGGMNQRKMCAAQTRVKNIQLKTFEEIISYSALHDEIPVYISR